METVFVKAQSLTAPTGKEVERLNRQQAAAAKNTKKQEEYAAIGYTYEDSDAIIKKDDSEGHGEAEEQKPPPGLCILPFASN